MDKENVGGVVVAAAFMLVILGAALANVLGVGAPRLEVVTSAAESATGWRLTGRVIYADATLVDNAEVWAIAADTRGNRYSPNAVKTGPTGEFSLDPIPGKLGGGEIAQVTIFAKAKVKQGNETRPVAGKDVLTVGQTGRTRWVELPPLALVTIPTIFVISIIVGLIQVGDATFLLKLKYYGSVLLAFLFTVAMIIYISVGLRFVNVTVSDRTNEVLSLGFANIYHGTYVKDVEPEWLFSLTSPAPPQAAEAPAIARGFGAPLWILLLSVIGSGVFTVSIILKQIQEPAKFDDGASVRARVEEVVRHQFYILFAPLGAVIVYQLLVAAGSASQQATVALAALAAGVALNLVLDKAVEAAKSLLK